MFSSLGIGILGFMKRILQAKDSGIWVAFEKGTRNEIARESSYAALIKKTGDISITYLKVPSSSDHKIFYN